MNQLIHCITCDALFLKTPFDREPEYEYAVSVSFASAHPIEKDDFKDFMKNHHDHRMEDLTILEDSLVSDKDYAEPVKVSYFRATNGKENFVVRKFREKIGEPLRYELIAGDYSVTCVSLDIQAREIEKQMLREFAERPLSRNKIDSFIRLYDHTNRKTPPSPRRPAIANRRGEEVLLADVNDTLTLARIDDAEVQATGHRYYPRR